MSTEADFRKSAPAEWKSYWDRMPNSVSALYAIVEYKAFPALSRKEIRVDAWGQLCFDEAAGRATAYHVFNKFPLHGKGWRMISWRVEMDGPCVGNAKMEGCGAEHFDKTMTDLRSRHI